MDAVDSCALIAVAANKLDNKTEVVIVDFDSDILRSRCFGSWLRTEVSSSVQEETVNVLLDVGQEVRCSCSVSESSIFWVVYFFPHCAAREQPCLRRHAYITSPTLCKAPSKQHD